jgi:hypothetical protein
MSDRYTHFLIDVPIPGDPDLIAQADDDHLLGHAQDALVETVGETPARWFEPDSVEDATATFRLRVGTSHTGEPTDTEALHAALRVVRGHAGDTPLDAGSLRFDGVTPTGPLGEHDTPTPNAPESTGIDNDTETDTERDTESDTGSDTADTGGTTPDEAAKPQPDTDDGKFRIERDDAGGEGRQGLLASAMRGDE